MAAPSVPPAPQMPEPPTPPAMPATVPEPAMPTAVPQAPEMPEASVDPRGYQPVSEPTEPVREMSMNTPPDEFMREREQYAGGMATEYTEKKPQIIRSILMIVGIVVGVFLILAGAWWAISAFILGDDSAPTTQTSDDTPAVVEDDFEDFIDPTPTVQEGDTETPAVEDNTRNSESDVILFGEPSDRDDDRLTDEEELMYGTDPNDWDTDNDELSDSAEIRVWNTDPLNPDTDGDGYLDGLEVRASYSPTGPGKIFAPPTAESTTSATTSSDMTTTSPTMMEDDMMASSSPESAEMDMMQDDMTTSSPESNDPLLP
jgi:cytoskeletal protein RodZ